MSARRARPAVAQLLATIQREMLARAVERREARSVREPIIYDRFRELMDGEGAFVYAGWNGDPAVEAKVKEETKATIRVIPDANSAPPTRRRRVSCTGKPATHEVLWARAY